MAALIMALAIAATGLAASGPGSGGGGGGGGGGGTTTPPPPVSTDPCASIEASSASITRSGVLTKMATNVTSCSGVTMTGLVVVWDPGPGWEFALGCVAPQTSGVNPGSSFSLSPGAHQTVNCQTSSPAAGGTFVSGTGTVTLYDNCKSLDRESSTGTVLPDDSTLDPSLLCSQVPSTQLAQAPFFWDIALAGSQPPQGGNRGG